MSGWRLSWIGGARRRRWRSQFRHLFNEERPHEALGQTPPAAHYDPPPRPYGGREREPEYDAAHQVRRVRRNGEIKWRGRLVFIGEAFIGEPVGLEEIDEDCWAVRYGPVDLGSLDAKGKFVRVKRGARPALDPDVPSSK